MGEGEVIQFLEKQKEPLTSGEIAKGMDESPTKISRILKQLIKFHEVNFVEIDRFESMKRCGSRRRIYLYFVE